MILFLDWTLGLMNERMDDATQAEHLSYQPQDWCSWKRLLVNQDETCGMFNQEKFLQSRPEHKKLECGWLLFQKQSQETLGVPSRVLSWGSSGSSCWGFWELCRQGLQVAHTRGTSVSSVTGYFFRGSSLLVLTCLNTNSGCSATTGWPQAEECRF